jgi:hypothetical protein
MKRHIYTVGLFGLCCLALLTSTSVATSGFGCWGCHHNRCVTHITCRPYNAFTPICWGNLVCDGCCPSPCGSGGCMPMGCGMPSYAGMGCGMPCMGPSCSPQQGYAGDMAPAQPMPNIRTTPFTPPMPMPSGPGTTMVYPYNNVSQANYYQYVPQYYPNYYTPNYYQPAPYYWYGYGR